MQDDSTSGERGARAERHASDGRTPEPGSIGELIREHYTPALRYAVRLLRDRAEAEDCVQEAFAEAFLHLPTLRDPGAAAGWLRSIVRHRCSRRTRRRDLELVPLEHASGDWPAGDAGGGATPGPARGSSDEHSGWACSPEERIARRRLARLLVMSLAPHEREIVLLFYVKECSQREIASFLGLPLSTVNNRLHDARERMKQWERHMHTTRMETSPAADDRALRLGTVVRAEGPLIEARFEPDAPFDLFDALAIVGDDGKCVERMKVAHRAGDGRVICLPTGSVSGAIDAGTSVLNTGKVGLDLTRMRGVHGTSPGDLLAAVAAMQRAGARTFAPTGIKALDLLCPLPARGVVAQAATGGVGRIVLLDEIAQRLACVETNLTLLCLVERSEVDPYRSWSELTLWGQSAGIGFYWALSDQGTDPECPALDACDAAIYLSPLLAVRGWYPAIDAEHSRSRLLTPALVGEAHCALAARAREELVFLKRTCADPVLLELLAARAFAAARRRALSHVPSVTRAESARLARARKLQLFLTQPFGVASEWTGWPSEHVPVSETLAGCRAILDGAVDDVPESAFAYAGTLDQVRRHASSGVARSYGE